MSRYRRPTIEGGNHGCALRPVQQTACSIYRAAPGGLSCGSGASPIRNGCHLHPAGPHSRHLDATARRCRFSIALEPNQKRVFPWASCGAIEIEEPSKPTRNRNLATTVWEHAIRDDADFERHVDYIHFNPVKHGYVTRVSDWPYSSFHRYVKNGLLPEDWGGDLAEIEGRFGE